MNGFLKSNSQINRRLQDSDFTPRKRNIKSLNMAAGVSLIALPVYTFLLFGGKYEFVGPSLLPDPEEIIEESDCGPDGGPPEKLDCDPLEKLDGGPPEKLAGVLE
ncbi:hypothetical protein ACKWTF_008356 [Chironomus riparius]